MFRDGESIEQEIIQQENSTPEVRLVLGLLKNRRN